MYGLKARHRIINATVLSRMARLAFDTKVKYVSRYSAMFETLVVVEEEEEEQKEEEE